MAKDRSQVGPLAPPPSVTPRAAPVDTFARPGVSLRPEGQSQLSQLAGALVDFQPHLNALASDLHATDVEEQFQQGTNRVLTDKQLQNRDALNQAVKDGRLPEAANPWFLKGMQHQIGRMEGDKFDAALREAYANSDSKHNSDITDFTSSFTAAYLQKSGLDTAEKDVTDTLQPSIQRSLASLKATHVARWEDEQSKLVRDRLYREVGDSLDNHLVYSAPDEMGVDIKNRIDALVSNGMNGTDANRMVIDAITDKAIERQDTSVLEMLDKVDTGNGKLGGTQYAKDKRYAAEVGITSRQQELERTYWSNQARREKETKEALQSQIATALVSDPNADVKPLIKALSGVDGQAGITATQWVESLKDDQVKVHEDPVEKAKLWDALYSGGSKGLIMEYAAAHKISASSVDDAYKSWDIIQAHKDLIDDPMFNSMISDVGRSVSGGDFTGDPQSQEKGRIAKNFLREAIVNYKQTNPNASKADVFQHLIPIQKAIISQIAPDVATSGVSDVPSPTLKNVIEGPKPKATEPAAAPAEAPKAQAKPLYKSKEDLKTAVDEYYANPTTSRLGIQAEARGQSVEEFLREQRRNIPK